MVLGVNEPSNGILGTFLCDADAGTCPLCQPSCIKGCKSDNTCDAMLIPYTVMFPNFIAVSCDTSPKVDYTAGCTNPCHESCTTCSGSNAAANECTGCKASGAMVAPSSPGTCVCGSGFVQKNESHY